MQTHDGLQNLVANLGTSRDKAAAGQFATVVDDPQQYINAYRGSALVRKIIDKPARDCFREWREWQGEAPQISALEAEEKRLGVKLVQSKMERLARLKGGAAVYIATRDRNPAEPLDPETIGLGDVRHLNMISREFLSPKEMQTDADLPGFGLPAMWTLSIGGRAQDVHPSRLVIRQGAEVLDETMAPTAQGWSDSVLTAMFDTVRDMTATMANIAALVYEAKVDVLKIPDLMQSLQTGGEAFEKLLLRRATLAQTGKGINGTLLMDAAEDYDQKSPSFATLPDIADRFMLMVSMAADMPRTVLFGESPGGMQSNGDEETRNYYDQIKARQTDEIEPAMAILDECLIRSALGSRPDELWYSWRPLWQPKQKERAETGKIIAEALKVCVEIGALSDEAAAVAAVNALTETGAFPGLESAAAEFEVTEPDPVEIGSDDIDQAE